MVLEQWEYNLLCSDQDQLVIVLFNLIAYSRSPTPLRMASGRRLFFGLGAIQRAVRLRSRGWGGLASYFVHGSRCSVGHKPRSLGLKGHRAYHPGFLAVCCERAILKLVIVESLRIVHLRAPPLVCRVRCCVARLLMAPLPCENREPTRWPSALQLPTGRRRSMLGFAAVCGLG